MHDDFSRMVTCTGNLPLHDNLSRMVICRANLQVHDDLSWNAIYMYSYNLAMHDDFS